MIVGGLIVALANAQPVPDEVQELPRSEVERLLGPEPAGPPAELAPRPVIDTFSWWPFVLVGLGAGALWWIRRRIEQGPAKDTGSELRVVGRADLSGQSALAVVEVRDRSGSWRRLVIGTGDGTPQLVADLGEPQFGFLGEDEDSTVQELGFVPPSPKASVEDLPSDFAPYEPLPSPSEAGLPPLPADPKSGRALVHEVLGERRRKPRSRRSTSFQTFA
ncbi:MAG: flagellar biosynthetic protein FliO [Myxococcota bacterium]